MKREHLECLMIQCADGCLGPPFQPVPLDIWQAIIDQGIISETETPKMVWSTDYKNNTEGQGHSCYYEGGENWSITGFDDDELIRLHSEGKINICTIDSKALFQMVAKQWELNPAFVELNQDLLTIGWKGQDTVVIFAHSIDLYNSPYLFCLEVLESIQEDLLVVFEEIILLDCGDEDLDIDDLLSKWECRFLYVINPGVSCDRNAVTQQELLNAGITLLGTQDFLTEDGEPLWDATFTPRPLLTYSGVDKEFKWDGKPLDLKPTELMIFTLLWTNISNIVSIDELIEGTWPPGRKRKKRAGAKRTSRPEWPESNLQTHISQINSKLKITGKVSIENVREKGYKLVVKQ